MENDQDQMELKPVELFDPIQKRHYSVLVPDNLRVVEKEEHLELDDDESYFVQTDNSQEPATTWSQNETLALINIFSLHKHKFKHFKMKKDRWKLVSKELAKIGIDKLPIKCEIKWRNLLRSYRAYRAADKAQGKFEFYNEIDDIVANDPQFKNLENYTSAPSEKIILKPKVLYEEPLDVVETPTKKRKCSTCRSEKQKRHDERMMLLRKKLEIEERKVRAFEDYIQFLKTTHQQAI